MMDNIFRYAWAWTCWLWGHHTKAVARSICAQSSFAAFILPQNYMIRLFIQPTLILNFVDFSNFVWNLTARVVDSLEYGSLFYFTSFVPCIKHWICFSLWRFRFTTSSRWACSNKGRWPGREHWLISVRMKNHTDDSYLQIQCSISQIA